ncbi:MAG: endolytic transglycosylase MltG [bacterium]|nr:endolytic transglycosylase MltG [bacterium]
MDGFKKPVKKRRLPVLSREQAAAQDPTEKNFDRQAFMEAQPPKPARRWPKKVAIIFAGIFAAMITFCGVAFFQYQNDIAYKAESGVEKTFTVEQGDTVSTVAEELKNTGLISSKFSFEIYARLNHLTNMRVGKYSFSAKMTIPEILKYLNEGQVSTDISIMFLPGGTVAMAKQTMLKAGFSNQEVEEAFAEDYSSEFPELFAGKPADSDLEGFLYGETHTFEKGTPAKNIIRRFLSDFEKKVVELNLASKFKEKGLNLYEGITLASIVQKETLNNLEDKKDVAGVFYNRLRADMTLGSDVTYQYITDKMGVSRDVNYDSPYNLRRYKGLTPTPIATPSVDALVATAEPNVHNYLYFLSGDDDKTYFAVTNSEHEQNIKNHCQEKCQII